MFADQPVDTEDEFDVMAREEDFGVKVTSRVKMESRSGNINTEPHLSGRAHSDTKAHINGSDFDNNKPGQDTKTLPGKRCSVDSTSTTKELDEDLDDIPDFDDVNHGLLPYKNNYTREEQLATLKANYPKKYQEYMQKQRKIWEETENELKTKKLLKKKEKTAEKKCNRKKKGDDFDWF